MSNPIALKRIKKELEEIKRNPPLEISVGPTDDSNLYHWEGIMSGPDGTPYAGGVFRFMVDFPKDYPMKPPAVRFITKVYHPNVSADTGDICVSTLKNDWSSVNDISKVMLSISSLLNEPNPDSALNADSASLFRTDKKAYKKTVKEWVKKYASPESL